MNAQTASSRDYLTARDRCPECDETGENMCSECGSVQGDCEACCGTGWSSAVLDTAAFAEAAGRFRRQYRITFEWIEGDRHYGIEALRSGERLPFKMFIHQEV